MLSGSLGFMAYRLLSVVPVLFGVSLLSFLIVNALPTNAAQQLLGPEATAEQIARLVSELNLDRPVFDRYLIWLRGVIAGDLGVSFASQLPVATLVFDRLTVTLELVIFASVLSLALAVPMALLSARKPQRLADRFFKIVSMAGLSVPSYVLALVLVLLFAVELAVLPSLGITPLEENFAQHVASLVLPAVAIAFPLSCFYARYLRGDLLEQTQMEGYVITAVAKGCGPWRVLLAHALRNSLFGLLTIVGLNFGVLIGGTVVIEQIFAIPGAGRLLLQALDTRDIPTIQGVVLALTLVTVLANLGVDLLYAVLDPRIRYGLD